MKKKEVIEQLIAAIGQLGTGFVWKASIASYVKTEGDVRYYFGPHIVRNHSEFFMSPEVFVGHKAVNSVFEQVLNRKVNPGYTYGFGLRNRESRHNCEPDPGVAIADQTDIERAAVVAQNDFTRVAVPFFQAVKGLNGLDATLNCRDDQGQYEGRYRPRGYQSAFMGLIVAGLVKNPDLSEIYAEYVASFEKASTSDLTAIMNYFQAPLLLPG